MSYLEGVYWDLDGTIANTELEAHLPAFNKSFKDLGIDWHWDKKTYIDLLKINGGKNRINYYSSTYDYNFSIDFIRQIHESKQINYLKLIEEGAVKLKIGVYRLILELKDRGVRQFIVTSSSNIQVKTLIANLFREPNPFEFCISSEDVISHKPDPSPYLKAVKLSGINKSNSLVFEDSIPGLISSNKAKLPTICVKSNIPMVFDMNLKLSCLIDKLGDLNDPTKIIIGPKLNNKYIDYKYLNDFLQNF